MSRGNDVEWTKGDECLLAVTRIGRYRVARSAGRAFGVSAYFRRGIDETELGCFGTIERARERCEQHFAEMRHILGR